MASQIKRAVERYGPDRVVATSFTRAAATELAGRDIPIPEAHLGTLHALCYRAMGSPDIAETKLPEWNEFVDAYHRLSGTGADIDEPAEFEGKTVGDWLLRDYMVRRARMEPEETWPSDIRSFHAKWSDWKSQTGYVDFVDMLEFGIEGMSTAPGAPKALFCDETQDCSRLQFALLRKWGAQVETFILVGDEDQSIYVWNGASPEDMLDPPLPDENVLVLRHSYRLPRTIHSLADKWIRRVKRRQPKDYAPRDAEGVVRVIGEEQGAAHWKAPSKIIELLEGEGTAMALTTCSYMLAPLLSELRSRGIPFHNPYRRRRGDWNPLAGRIARDALIAFLRPDPRQFGSGARRWMWGDLASWVPLIRAKGNLRRGAKKIVSERGQDYAVAEVSSLLEIFEEGALQSALDLDLKWFSSSLLKKNDYHLEVLRKHGVAGLMNTPRTIVGTIHSVKGGESDRVVLFPDLSRAGYKDWTDKAGKDNVIRQFYVGMTRAREELILCKPRVWGRNSVVPAVKWPLI